MESAWYCFTVSNRAAFRLWGKAGYLPLVHASWASVSPKEFVGIPVLKTSFVQPLYSKFYVMYHLDR
jgi:hypothetical protein